MLASYPLHGFGAVANGGSLVQLAEKARAQAQYRQRYGGFGDASSDWNTFYNGGATAYQDAARVAYCNRDSANRIQCVLQDYPAGAKAQSGPVANMQKATDALINKIPVWHMQVGQQADVTDPTTGQIITKTIDALPDSPILHGSGYDGIVGPSTAGYVMVALILAGALKQIPERVGMPYINPTEANITAYAFSIASYLKSVVDNFDNLLAAYLNRNRQPATDVFEPSTVPSLAPYVPAPDNKKRTALIIGTAAAMAGVTGFAAFNAANKKPAEMYEGSSNFGRRRKRSR